jgi:hypothetical protein
MTAREIDEADARLRDLRTRSIADLTLAGVAFCLALVASRLAPSLALPLLAGGVAGTVVGLRAVLSRYFLVGDLACDPDAYALVEVRRHAERVASLEHRQVLAHELRAALRAAAGGQDGELLRAVELLEDETLPIEPRAIVSIERSLHAGEGEDGLRAPLHSLLAGFGR